MHQVVKSQSIVDKSRNKRHVLSALTHAIAGYLAAIGQIIILEVGVTFID